MQFKLKASKNKMNINKKSSNFGKQANVSRVSFSIPLRLSKKVLEKSEFYKGNVNSSSVTIQNSQLYAQVSKSYIKNIVKIKKNFPNLLTKKIKEVHKILNKLKKDKLELNIITKELLRKQVIVLMSSVDSERFIVSTNIYPTLTELSRYQPRCHG